MIVIILAIICLFLMIVATFLKIIGRNYKFIYIKPLKDKLKQNI